MYASYKTLRAFQNLCMYLPWILAALCKKCMLCLTKKKSMNTNINAFFLALSKPDPIKHRLIKLLTLLLKRDLSKKAQYHLGKCNSKPKLHQTSKQQHQRQWEANIHRRGSAISMILLRHSRVRRRMYSWITKQRANGLKSTDLVVNMKVRHTILISIPCHKEIKYSPATTT